MAKGRKRVIPDKFKIKQEFKDSMQLSELADEVDEHKWLTLVQFADIWGITYNTVRLQVIKGNIPAIIRVMKTNQGEWREQFFVHREEVESVWQPRVNSKRDPNRKSARSDRKKAPKGSFRDSEGNAILPTAFHGTGSTDVVTDPLSTPCKDVDYLEENQEVTEIGFSAKTPVEDDEIFGNDNAATVQAKSKAKKEYFQAENEKAKYLKTIGALVDYDPLLAILSDLFTSVSGQVMGVIDRIEQIIGEENARIVEDELRDALSNMADPAFMRRLEKLRGLDD